MFVQDRNQAREFFFQVWDKLKNQRPLEPIEAIISDVIMQHPEYHVYLDNKEESKEHDFTPEQGMTNPFLHMGMHIAIKEQVSADRPSGIHSLYKILITKADSIHDIEHKMMECLGQCLWEAQHNNGFPDENKYLECLKGIN